MIAIFVCLVGSGLALFFVLPRSVSINEIGILEYNVTINLNDSSAMLNMKVTIPYIDNVFQYRDTKPYSTGLPVSVKFWHSFVKFAVQNAN